MKQQLHKPKPASTNAPPPQAERTPQKQGV
jgi:hypothetical protein